MAYSRISSDNSLSRIPDSSAIIFYNPRFQGSELLEYDRRVIRSPRSKRKIPFSQEPNLLVLHIKISVSGAYDVGDASAM
jgi:hypothetical protein